MARCGDGGIEVAACDGMSISHAEGGGKRWVSQRRKGKHCTGRRSDWRSVLMSVLQKVPSDGNDIVDVDEVEIRIGIEVERDLVEEGLEVGDPLGSVDAGET